MSSRSASICDTLLRVLQIPTIGFLYIAGWIGYVGRDYLIAARKESKPREKEYIIDVPQALKMAWQVKRPPLPKVFVDQHLVICPTMYGGCNVYCQEIRLMRIPSSPPPKSVSFSLLVCSVFKCCCGVCRELAGHSGPSGNCRLAHSWRMTPTSPCLPAKQPRRMWCPAAGLWPVLGTGQMVHIDPPRARPLLADNTAHKHVIEEKTR